MIVVSSGSLEGVDLLDIDFLVEVKFGFGAPVEEAELSVAFVLAVLVFIPILSPAAMTIAALVPQQLVTAEPQQY